jgi:hypothetical protein
MWDLWWKKRHWDRFSPSTSVSPPIVPHLSSAIIIRDWYNRPVVASVIVDWIPLHLKEKNVYLETLRQKQVFINSLKIRLVKH